MISDFYAKLAAVRRRIHAHPEISENEFETTAFLKEYISKLGIHILETDLPTGFIAEIGQGEPVIALRADIDAKLPFNSNKIFHPSSQPFSCKIFSTISCVVPELAGVVIVK